MTRIAVAAGGLLLGDAAVPASACGQAWVPPKGEATLSITYQNYYVTGHFDRDGQKDTNGGTHTKSVITALDYGVTDNIGLSFSLPFIASKYTGAPSYFVGPFETFPGPLDDGKYHATFQDVRVDVRYMAVKGRLAVTPFVAASVPTHNYETVGEAVPGKHRREFLIGASGGTVLDRILPDTYVDARYSYAVAEGVRNTPYTHSNIDLEVGHAATSRIGLRALVGWQISHKGPHFEDLAEDWRHHDRLVASNYLNLGGGVSVSLSRSADVYALWIPTVSGKNGAHVARALAVGTSWRLGGRLSVSRVSPGSSLTRAAQVSPRLRRWL